ncbi:hypothetical protein DPMN_078191 [Dreissena polymorpha]|uniref:Uncharacterized protein n=1 Tax=Dreissena polymorpha TaxID=45954 RepID=A0A9D3YNC7_DREPO|nr:hypothetical protein DPMN_078191 [Dreissena polymorpha]
MADPDEPRAGSIENCRPHDERNSRRVIKSVSQVLESNSGHPAYKASALPS